MGGQLTNTIPGLRARFVLVNENTDSVAVTDYYFGGLYCVGSSDGYLLRETTTVH